ncbi:MAG: DUF5309 domain-containing protein [Novosphingobium sp.]|nr:DUF5309 domain-containing protein [Novosphingobium sp.]
MAVPNNTLETYSAIGNAEDVSDIIYLISPTETPFMSNIESVDARARLHQWQTDSLAAAATNVEPEGDDPDTNAATVTVMLSNSCQISDKVPRVSGTQEAVAKYGRKSEMNYQLAKMSRELKRDMEFDLLANNAEVTGSSGTARELGGIEAWITSDDRGTSGSDGGTGDTAATDGTQRAFTEASLKNVLQECFDSGGDPDTIMLGSFNKQAFSGFTGNATRYKDADDERLVAGIDVYASDFGVMRVVANRFMRSRSCLILQMDMWAIAYLRPFTVHDLAKTGDSIQKQILVEYTLEARNQASSGIVADLTTAVS